MSNFSVLIISRKRISKKVFDSIIVKVCKSECSAVTVTQSRSWQNTAPAPESSTAPTMFVYYEKKADHVVTVFRPTTFQVETWPELLHKIVAKTPPTDWLTVVNCLT